MADLDLNRLLRGGMDLATAFGRGDDAYNTALAKRAQVEGLVLDARNKRDASMARDELSGLLMESGNPADRQMALAIRSGVNPKLLGDLFSGALPNEVRTFQMMTDGLSKEDRERARRINLGLDGRASGAALKYEQVIGPDGVPRYMAFDPNAPLAQQVMTGGYSGFSTQPGRAPVQQQVWAQPGATYQTPQGIARIDPNIDPAALSLAQADMVGGGSADNYSLPPRDVTPQQFYGGQGGAPVVGRRKEDEAGAVEAAKQRAQLDFLPQELGMRTRAAVDQAAGIDAAKRQQERSSGRVAAEASVRDAENNLDRLSTQARQLMQHRGLSGITGVMGSIPDMPGSDAANARAELESLKSQVGFGVLQAMREASKTGGALGSVSDTENQLLQSNLAALANSQSLESFKQNLQKIIDYAEGAKGRMRRAFDEQYAQPTLGGALNGGPTGRAPAVGTIEGGYRFRGGNPSDPSSWEKL